MGAGLGTWYQCMQCKAFVSLEVLGPYFSAFFYKMRNVVLYVSTHGQSPNSPYLQGRQACQGASFELSATRKE